MTKCWPCSIPGAGGRGLGPRNCWASVAPSPVVAGLGGGARGRPMLIGIAPVGGESPPPWRRGGSSKRSTGMDVLSGCGSAFATIRSLPPRQRTRGVRLVDVRKNDERDVATFKPFRDGCLRIHTVGHDCSCGKMVVSFEVARGPVENAGTTAKFIATGQTGILIEGDGCPVDRVISRFP